MCNEWCLEFARESRTALPEGARELRVLEVGSRIVNGSVREVFLPLALSYVGVDLDAGPGVDSVLSVYDLGREFERESFDLVLSTEMLEHCADWRSALFEMLRVLRPGGHLLLTTRSPGFALHDWPADHWRFSRADLERIFAPVGGLARAGDDLTLGWPSGVGVLVRRTADDRSLGAWRASLDRLQVRAVDPERDREHRPPGAAVAVERMTSERRDELRAALARVEPWLEDAAARALFEESGVSLQRAGPRSSSPTRAEVAASREYTADGAAWQDERLFPAARQEAFVERLLAHGADFDPPGDGDRRQGFFWRNGRFSGCDAMLLYALTRHLRPRRVVQVGSPLAAAVVDAALRGSEAGRITRVGADAGAQPEALERVDELLARPLQELGPEELNERLGPQDLLSIETSHVAKTGSDCTHLYLRLLPALRAHVVVHLQDVFLPDAYPRRWVEELGCAWNEQLLVLAMLRENPRWRVLASTRWLERHRPDLAVRLMRGRAAGGGASLWLERLGADGAPGLDV